MRAPSSLFGLCFFFNRKLDTTLLVERVERAAIELEPPLIEMECLTDRAVEQIPVMRDDHQRVRITRQIGFQP